MSLAGASRRRRAPRSRPPLPLIAIFLLLAVTPPPRASALRVPLREVAALLSLSHSLLTRVAVARADRGDAAAAARARWIASHLSLLSSRGAWALGWDYLHHYAFSSTAGCGLSCATAAARLLAAVAEASRLQSTADAAQWLRRNYGDLQAAAAQLLTGLLAAFSEQGPLREVVGCEVGGGGEGVAEGLPSGGSKGLGELACHCQRSHIWRFKGFFTPYRILKES